MWKGINGDVAVALDSHYYLGCGNRGGVEREVVYKADKNNGKLWDGTQIAPTLSARNANGAQRMPDKENFNCVITEKKAHPSGFNGQDVYSDLLITEECNEMSNTRVRRLTPKECERLQAFPDDWTNLGEWTDSKGKKHRDADSPRYKALGNSIACCAWIDILQGIADLCPEDEKTLGSLFAGIGGFDLIWERLCGGKSVWSSEIEEFCVAVLKKHFGDDGNEPDKRI